MASYPKLLNSELFRDISADDYQAYDLHFDISKSNVLRDLNQEDLLSFGDELPLHTAAISGNIKAVKKILAKTDINIRNNKSYSALHWASIGGKTEVAKYLVAAGADINALTDRGESSLHWAVRSNCLELVKFLLKNTSPPMIDQENFKGFTAMHFVASKGNLGIYRLLFSAGANLFIRNSYGATALHWACLNEGALPDTERFLGKQKIAEHIVEQSRVSKQNTFLNSMNKIGKTALHWACISEFTAVVEKLLDENCDPSISTPPFASLFDDLKNNKIAPKIVKIFEERGLI